MITQTQWENFDRLVGRLQTIAPEKFDYWLGYPMEDPECTGCVVVHACAVDRELRKQWRPMSSGAVLDGFLGITREEAQALFTPVVMSAESAALVGCTPRSENTVRGSGGITEALRRLAVLETRYLRPTVAAAIPAWAPDDAAFLAACRLAAAVPLEALA
jgi:hypothetical protein